MPYHTIMNAPALSAERPVVPQDLLKVALLLFSICTLQHILILYGNLILRKSCSSQENLGFVNDEFSSTYFQINLQIISKNQNPSKLMFHRPLVNSLVVQW